MLYDSVYDILAQANLEGQKADGVVAGGTVAGGRA